MKVLDSGESIESFIKNNKIAMLYFSSEGCSVCGVLLPKIEELLKKYPKIEIVKIEVDELQSAVGKYSVFTLPCILLLIEGKELIREARFISVVDLEEKIKRFYDLI